jgi:hypothetical protein
MKQEYWVNHQLFRQNRGASMVNKLSGIVLDLLKNIELLSKYKSLTKKQKDVLDKKWDYYFRMYINLQEERIRIGARVSLLNKILK